MVSIACRYWRSAAMEPNPQPRNLFRLHPLKHMSLTQH